MAQAGIIITQPGVDVKTAADYQMIFNSNWPSLQIAFESVTTIAGSTFNVPITHNLGFFAFTQVWNVTGGTNNGRITTGITFDKNKVIINNYGSTSITYSIKCYNLDITSNKSYILPLAPTFKTPYDASFGIKVVKNGKNITSSDLRDFILHSRAQSPAILNVITTPTTTTVNTTGSQFTTYQIAFSNPAGYIPWAFGFASNDSVTFQIVSPGPAQALPSFYFSYPAIVNGVQSNQVVLTSSNNGTGTTGIISLVVLRDPLILSKAVSVRY